MQFSSARDLKLELLETIVDPFVQASVGLPVNAVAAALAKSIGIAAKPFSVAAGAVGRAFHRSIALGIAPGKNGYKLAVRVQRQGLMQSEILDAIQKKAKGEVDLRLIGRVDKRAGATWQRTDVRPMTIGCSIAHYRVTAGTLGAFVDIGGVPHALSNNHVLAHENRGKSGDPILQRSRNDGGSTDSQAVGTLNVWVPLSISAPTPVDAAVARIQSQSFDPGLLRGIAKGADRKLKGVGLAEDGGMVFKIGRTTGVTEGRITALELDNLVVGFAPGNVRFDDVIEIEGTTAKPFSDGGDSGSLILNESMEGVGLLFSGTDYGGQNGLGLTYANHLQLVLDCFGATLIR